MGGVLKPVSRLLGAALLLATLARPAAAAEAFRCLACPTPITQGSYLVWQVDGRSYYAHGAHGQLPSCRYCQGLLGRHSPWGQGGRLDDGRVLCNGCLRSSIRDVGTAAATVGAVRRKMESWGMKFPWGRIPVQLVGRGTLAGRAGGHHPGQETTGLTNTRIKRWSDGRKEVDGLEILMLYGMPAPHFEKTAAHELMHAWMSLAGAPQDASPPFAEGACNLVAYFYLQTRGSGAWDKVRHHMLKNPDPVYGEGLRRQIRYATDHRVSGLLRILPEARDFPPGY